MAARPIPNEQCTLISPELMSQSVNQCLSFKYKSKGTIDFSIRHSDSDKLITLWSRQLSGDTDWTEGAVILEDSKGSIMFTVSSPSHLSLLMLDDVLLKPGPCQLESNKSKKTLFL